MKLIAHLILTIAAIFIGVVALAVAAYFYVSTDSWGASDFRAKLVGELERQGSARIGDLVSFKWEQVYLLHPYELMGEPRRSKEVGGSEDWGYWWEDQERFWTVVFKRPNSRPFLIKMLRSDWDLRDPKRSTTSPDAKLVWIKQGHPEYRNCDRTAHFCIILD